MSSENKRTVGFIGAGKMGFSLAVGMVKAGVVPADSVVLFDTYAPALIEAKAKGFRVASENKELISDADVIFLAVKPQTFDQVKSDFNGVDMSKKVLVSIMAGITIQSLSMIAPTTNMRIIRVMPNTPCLVNESASAFAANQHVVESDKKFVSSVLSAVGVCCEVAEHLLDAVAGVSGAGPAYLYMVIEAMADAGVKLGLTRDVSIRLAAQTAVGAGTMVLETQTHPAILKSEVCSTGGATICGVAELERLGLRHSMMRACEATCEKCKALAKEAK